MGVPFDPTSINLKEVRHHLWYERDGCWYPDWNARIVNNVEVASELAHADLVRQAEMQGEGELFLYKDPTSNELTYRDDIQDVFNELYDKYLKFL